MGLFFLSLLPLPRYGGAGGVFVLGGGIIVRGVRGKQWRWNRRCCCYAVLLSEL